MEKIGNLTPAFMQEQHHRVMKRFDHYFSKWIEFLSEKDVSVSQIVWEWINEMLFGYMGV